mgnify:CR=1 FL=1
MKIQETQDLDRLVDNFIKIELFGMGANSIKEFEERHEKLLTYLSNFYVETNCDSNVL